LAGSEALVVAKRGESSLDADRFQPHKNWVFCATGKQILFALTSLDQMTFQSRPQDLQQLSMAIRHVNVALQFLISDVQSVEGDTTSIIRMLTYHPRLLD
jgi:hypothetical protein